jgi:excinuclease UvrABC helicase subunit UvrB
MLVPESQSAAIKEQLEKMPAAKYEEFIKTNKIMIVSDEAHILAMKLQETGELHQVLDNGGPGGLMHRLRLGDNVPKVGIKLFESVVDKMFSFRVCTLLKQYDILTIKELLIYSEQDLADTPKFTSKVIQEIKSTLAENGLYLKGDEPKPMRRESAKTRYDLREEIDRLNCEKEKAVAEQDFERASNLRHEAAKLTKKLDKSYKDEVKSYIETDHDEFAEIVNSWRSSSSEQERLRINELLKEFGWDE